MTQNDLRYLRTKLAAAEKELAEQKWLFSQLLNSPTFRWTRPIRWAVNQLRRLKDGSARPHHSWSDPSQERTDPGEFQESTTSEVNRSFTALSSIALQNFLASGATLELPCSENPLVSIVVVLFNRAELTLACLRSIAEEHAEQIEVVVVDNGSMDETAQLLDRLRGVRILRNRENRHFLEGANQGAIQCRGEYILLLNNDAQLLPGSIRSALETIRISPDIGAVGAKIVHLDGRLQEAGSIIWRDGSCAGYGRGDDPLAPMYNFRRDVDYCSAVFLLTPRKIWERLGGFDETFKPEYYEETDYCARLWQQGFRVVYEPAATVLHYEFGSWDSTTDAIAMQARHQRVFEERHRAWLQTRPQVGSDNVLHARSRAAQRRVLVIDDRVPHRWLGSGFPRAQALLRTLHSQGHFVTLCMTDVISEPWELAYSDIPREIEIMFGLPPTMLESFLAGRKEYYSTLIVSRSHNMERLAPILKRNPKWFANVDVIYDAEALSTARDIGLRELLGKPMTQSEVHAAIASEVRLTSMVDRVISVSSTERNSFHRNGVKHVEVLGHSLQVAPLDASFESREGFLFVGAVHDEMSPNADSLVWFLTEVFPGIQNALGPVSLTIAGVNRSERIRRLAGSTVRITGHLATLETLYAEARLFIAPTRYGAGIPHKVHEAAARGLPVVATPLLAEQLGWSTHELAIAKDAESFSRQCIGIYTDAAKWTLLRHRALERVRKECSPEVFEEKVERILARSD